MVGPSVRNPPPHVGGYRVWAFFRPTLSLGEFPSTESGVGPHCGVELPVVQLDTLIAADAPILSNLDSTSTPQIQKSKKARILVVEDHAFVREGIVDLINRQTDLVCCGEADSIASTLGLVAAQKPNLVLLDLRLNDGESFELMGLLGLRFPEVAILVLSQYEETLYAERALQAGAKGYLMKQDASEELINAIRTVLCGKIHVSHAMARRMLHQSRQSPTLNPLNGEQRQC